MKKLYSRGVLISFLLLVFALTGCAAPKVIFPPIGNDATKSTTPGKFVWFDLFSTDTTTCEKFYKTLFGWDFKRTNESNAHVKTIFLQNKPIGNMIGGKVTQGNSQWLSYISTEDVDTTLNMAANNGGSIYREGKDMPNRGHVGVAIDPQGAPFAVLTSFNGDPAEAELKPNMWLGAELWTSDAKEAARFYQIIAGYDVQLVGLHKKVEYRILKTNGKRRGGIVNIPWKNTDPEWIPFIAVEDVATMMGKVASLGGKIIIAPDMSVKEGRLAIIADPSGAMFGIHQIK